MGTAELYLLIWEIVNVNKNNIGNFKILKEFTSMEEAKIYFQEVTEDMLSKSNETKTMSDGGTIIKLNDFIQDSGYASKYKIIKQN